MEVFQALIILFLTAFLLMLIKHDRSSRRVGRLKINGEVKDNFKVIVAKSWLNRRLGLLNHTELAAHLGLWLNNTSSVHTQAMLFPIDVVFLNSGNQIIHIAASVPPEQKKVKPPSKILFGSTLELAAGSSKSFLGLKVGDLLELVE
jgi:uncharacterized membrane protein (UPF0127 family)